MYVIIIVWRPLNLIDQNVIGVLPFVPFEVSCTIDRHRTHFVVLFTGRFVFVLETRESIYNIIRFTAHVYKGEHIINGSAATLLTDAHSDQKFLWSGPLCVSFD